MPSAKISALTAATAPLATDLHVLARSTSNRKLTTALLFHETLTVAAFQTLVTGSALIPGRSYKITGAGPLSNPFDVVVTAQAVDSWGATCQLITAGGLYLWATLSSLTSNPSLVIDVFGNQVTNYYGAALANRVPLGNASYEGNNIYHDTVILSNQLDGILRNNSIFGVSSLDCQNLTVERSTLVDTNISYNSPSTYLEIYDSTMSNVDIITDGTTAILNNCNFSNVTVEIINGADVIDNLTIHGSTVNGTRTVYRIDGTYKADVLDLWSGVVIAGLDGGSSTVRSRIDFSATYDGSNVWNLGYTDSVVGVFLMYENSGTAPNVWPVDTITDGPKSHPFRVRWEDNVAALNEVIFTFSNNYLSTASDAILIYQHHTTSIGSLIAPYDYMMLKREQLTGAFWVLEQGAHYH